MSNEKTPADESLHQQGLLVTSTIAVVVPSISNCHWYRMISMVLKQGVNQKVCANRNLTLLIVLDLSNIASLTSVFEMHSDCC